MLCFCGAHDLRVEDSTYVKDGKPMCHPVTCTRVGQRNEMAARRAPFFDDLGNEHDRVAEFYGRCRDDGSLVWTANRRKYPDI